MTVSQLILLIERILVALLAVVLYFYLLCSVYPSLCFKIVWKGDRSLARGIRRVRFEGGRGVIYIPALEVRKYMPKYAVFAKDGAKYLQCELDLNVNFLRYDVVSFDINQKLLDHVSVSEYTNGKGYTQALPLPTATAYAYVIPRKIDGMYESREKAFTHSRAGMWRYFILSVITTVIVSVFLRAGLTGIFSLMYRKVVPATLTSVIIGAVVAGALAALLCMRSYKSRVDKVINK